MKEEMWNNDKILLLHFRWNFSKDEKWSIFGFLIKDDVLKHNGRRFVKRNFNSNSSPSLSPSWVSWLLLINCFSLTFCAWLWESIQHKIVWFFFSRLSQFISFCHILSEKEEERRQIKHLRDENNLSFICLFGVDVQGTEIFVCSNSSVSTFFTIHTWSSITSWFICEDQKYCVA